MAQVQVSISYTDVPGFPAGTVVAGIQVDLVGPSGASQTVPAGTASVSFPDLAVGSYQFSVSALDTSNVLLGTPVVGSFEVTAPATVTLSLPVSASALVS